MLRSKAPADAIANGAAPSMKVCSLMISGIVSNSLIIVALDSSTSSADQKKIGGQLALTALVTGNEGLSVSAHVTSYFLSGGYGS